MFRKALLSLIALFIVIQLFQPNRELPVSNPANDIFAQHEASSSIIETVRLACYDCHSNEVNYPWYAYVSPASWWVSNHIQEGREELNFSQWGDYPIDRKDYKLEEVIEAIQEDFMPLQSYTWLHRKANLSDSQKAQLISWLKDARSRLNYQ